MARLLALGLLLMAVGCGSDGGGDQATSGHDPVQILTLDEARALMADLNQELGEGSVTPPAAISIRAKMQGRLLSAGVPADEVHHWINTDPGGR